ncbi:MAG: sigma-70 family RNA polymerase sigma factor [Candidatus Dormibacter sp.]
MALAFPQADLDVIALLAAGDSRAIESLYDRYGRLAFGLAFRMLHDRMAAEDVVQESFVALWRHARSFDSGRGQLRSWLLRIVRNRAIDRLRGNATHRETANIDDARLAVDDTAWDHVAADADRTQVRNLLNELPSGQRRAIELSYFGGLTQPEVAVTMRLPLGTVKSRQRLGLEKMRQALHATEIQ